MPRTKTNFIANMLTSALAYWGTYVTFPLTSYNTHFCRCSNEYGFCSNEARSNSNFQLKAWEDVVQAVSTHPLTAIYMLCYIWKSLLHFTPFPHLPLLTRNNIRSANVHLSDREIMKSTLSSAKIVIIIKLIELFFYIWPFRIKTCIFIMTFLIILYVTPFRTYPFSLGTISEV